MSIKRFNQSAVNFKTVTDLVGEKHAKEITALAQRHQQYMNSVLSKPAELPKYDFASLKKQMPHHTATLDKLQKQYEAIKIPFHIVPEKYMKEIDEYLKYVSTKMDFRNRIMVDAEEDEKKIKAKYENMPPIEHFRPEHFAKFFPEMHRDVRLPIERFTMGDKTTSTPEHFKELQELFKDYRSRELPGQS